MLWAYVLEVNGAKDNRVNAPLFQLIREMKVEDDKCFFDMGGTYDRAERKEMLEQIQDGDSLVVRSIGDIADSVEDLISTISILSEKQINLCSYEEPYLSEEKYLEQIEGIFRVYQVLTKKKQKQAYKQAVAAGKVGRPVKEKNIGEVLDLFYSGKMSMEQVQTLTGLSRSTIYRYKKDR